MDAEYASYYTQEVMLILIREFASPDEEMKKIVLKVTDSSKIFLMVFKVTIPFFIRSAGLLGCLRVADIKA